MFIERNRPMDSDLYGFDANIGMFNAIYNHAISGVMLGEVYGMTGKEQAGRVRAGGSTTTGVASKTVALTALGRRTRTHA